MRMSKGLVGRHNVASRALPMRSQRRSLVVAAATVEELNKQYGIEGSVQVVEGRGGLPTVVLKHHAGSSAEVVLFGGVVTSWKQRSGDEVLYVRPDAVFDKSKPISGGIPHCFPQFGPGPMQQHGFARNLDWSIASTSADPNPDDKDPAVELVLQESEYTQKMFPYKFKVVYGVSLHGDQLRTDFRVINTDDKPFSFTAALHTYIEVMSVDKAKVTGLKGLNYLDKKVDPAKPEKKQETREKVTFEGYVDSVYLDAPEHVELEVGTGAAVAIDSTGWTDTVLWNPFETMKSCYERFVCVENCKFGSPGTVNPGESWRATANFSVVDVPP